MYDNNNNNNNNNDNDDDVEIIFGFCDIRVELQLLLSSEVEGRG